MAEGDRVLLTHYKLVSLYPSEWPEGKDDDDEEEDTIETPKPSASAAASSEAKLKREKYKSRYATLERGTTLRTGVPGSQLSIDGKPNLAQKDEADPLGTSGSVIKLLRGHGVHIDDDLQLRNQFLLSSTTFSPGRFLSEAHSNASTEDLLRGLDFLSHSIEKKSASLKVLVESNFDLFVRAKATIDNVYREMRNHGADAEAQSRPSHSRQSSRNTQHWRSTSGTFYPSKSPGNEKRKNALIKESEYGVQGIRTPLLEANIKAEEVWGPALGGREREESLKTVMSSIDRNRAIFETGVAIEEDIKKRDYETLAEDYTRAQKFVAEAKTLVDRSKQNHLKLSDAQVHQVVITSRIWMDIQTRIDHFKNDVWSRLISEHADTPTVTSPGQKSDEYLELIAVLLQLGAEINPIMAWLQSRRDHLMNKIHAAFERVRIELEIARRRLASSNKPSAKVLASHLRFAADNRQQGDNARELDVPQVLRFWEKISTTLTSLLTLQDGGLLGEAMDFLETTRSFVDGTKQKGLPIGADGQSRKHHKFSETEVRSLHEAPLALFSHIYEQLHGLFVEPPIEDISQLFTPTPQSPQTPQSAMTPSSFTRFQFRPEDIPPSPRGGESWEKFAFWPPNSNSLSASTFLSNLLSTVAIAAGEIASVNLVKQDANMVAKLRNLVGDVRERSITAICAAWLRDSENMRELEDWTRSADKKEITTMPGYFTAFESSMLANLQKIVYISDAAGMTGASSVVLPPPQRHIETVQKTFKSGLYKAFSGMMEHAGKPTQSDGGISEKQDGLNGRMQTAINARSDGDAIDANNVNLRKLLTMSNFQTLRKEVIPILISQFESHFTMTISDDQKTAQDVLGQMNTGVFRSYVRPTVDALEHLISDGISDSSYAPENSERPSDAKPYIYDVLLTLVLVHTEVSKTAPALTSPVLSHLLEQTSTALIESFKKRKENYSLIALVQATLDVEFMAQTLNNYTTEKASDIQGKIYLALDERTDNEARMALQRELPEMRAVLKRLREGTKGEFACFRKERKSKDKEKDKSKR